VWTGESYDFDDTYLDIYIFVKIDTMSSQESPRKNLQVPIANINMPSIFFLVAPMSMFTMTF
jgi:hypothetical protein